MCLIEITVDIKSENESENEFTFKILQKIKIVVMIFAILDTHQFSLFF